MIDFIECAIQESHKTYDSYKYAPNQNVDISVFKNMNNYKLLRCVQYLISRVVELEEFEKDRLQFEDMMEWD